MQTSRNLTYVSIIAAFGLLSGCMGNMPKLPGAAAFASKPDAVQSAAQPSGGALDPELSDGSQSPIIASLIQRDSVLASGPFLQVADAVMASNLRRAEAELRAATLTAEATEKNWLPSIGPQVSLTSLGTVAASLLLEQTLFDGGRRKAERQVARADIEVAAVALSENSNERVRDALELYLDSEAAAARARVNAGGMERMNHFEWVMSERVKAGINDAGDLQVVRQRLAQMRSDLSADRERARSARSELSAMAATPVDGIHGISDVREAGSGVMPLALLKAEAVAKRADARADALTAGFLPGLRLGVNVDRGGATPGLNADFGEGIGFGAGARREAIEAEREAAQGRLREQGETTERALRALNGKLAEAERRRVQAHEIAKHAADNYTLFAAQLDAGRRAVPDVIGVFNTKISTERTAVDLDYEVARLKVQIAALKGVLVAGGKV